MSIIPETVISLNIIVLPMFFAHYLKKKETRKIKQLPLQCTNITKLISDNYSSSL